MASNITTLPVPNEQEVDTLSELLVNHLDKDVPDNVAIAALADLIGLIASMNDRSHAQITAMINWAGERAWNYATATWVRRAPRPDNVTALTPKKDDDKKDE